MGDSPITNTIENIAGRGVGLLGALTTIKGGGLGNYMMARARMMSDPGFRSTLAGSPFTSGFFGVSGDMGPAPAAPTAMPAAGGQAVAQPADVVGPPPPGVEIAQPGQTAYLPSPTAQTAPGYLPGTPRQWMPNLPPYDPKTALEQQGLATEQIGIQSPDLGQRAQYKMAAGIPLNDNEIAAAAVRARSVQALGGPGTTVQLDIPGMKTQVGSPYNFSAVTSEEYPTPQAAMAAAAARNANIPPGNAQWTVVPSGRGTFLLSPPATAAQTAPATPPPPAFRGPGGAATSSTPSSTTPPATIADRTNNPGNIKDGPYARSQPGYVGAGPTAAGGGNFAVFDSPASGFAAQGNLLRGPAYRNLSVGDALSKWSNGGYGGEVVTPLGIDPARKVGSLTPEELQTVTGAQARREGFSGGVQPAASAAPAAPPQVARAAPPAQPAAPAPQPAAVAPARPAPPPPPRPAVQAAPPPPVPAWQQNPNEVVPHVLVPAPQTGYPSAAFGGETPPSVPVPTTTLPPPGAGLEAAATPPPPLAPGAIPTDPTTGLPMSGKTQEFQGGSQSFTAPSIGSGKEALWATNAGITDLRLATPKQVANYEAQERAWNLRSKMDDAEVQRLRGGMSAGDAEGIRQLMDLRDNLNTFVSVYDTPEKRAQFVGPITWVRQGVLRDLNMSGSRDVADFRAALAPFSYDTLSDKDSPLTGDLKTLKDSAPSGSDSPAQFESDLQKLRDRIDTKIFQRTVFAGMPASEITAERINAATDAYQQARAASRVRTVEQATGAATPPPPAATPPPPAPSSAPPPGTAYAEPPAGPTGATPPAPPPAWQPNWIH